MTFLRAFLLVLVYFIDICWLLLVNHIDCSETEKDAFAERGTFEGEWFYAFLDQQVEALNSFEDNGNRFHIYVNLFYQNALYCSFSYARKAIEYAKCVICC